MPNWSDRVGLSYVVTMGWFCALCQRTFAPASVARSSPVYYDPQIADSLYDWSFKAMTPLL
jgi:hypothetical protein